MKNVQVESQTAATRVSGPTVEVVGKGQIHLEGGVVNVNTADKLADIPPPKPTDIPKPPDGPPAPTFHTPFS